MIVDIIMGIRARTESFVPCAWKFVDPGCLSDLAYISLNLEWWLYTLALLPASQVTLNIYSSAEGLLGNHLIKRMSRWLSRPHFCIRVTSRSRNIRDDSGQAFQQAPAHERSS